MITRRMALVALACASLRPQPATAQRTKVHIHKDPSCGCCAEWAERVGAAGFAYEIEETAQMSRLKARLGVPQRLASCHTALVGGYIIEGHVPPNEITRLLAEQPNGRGLAVPGMPTNSPGMEIKGASDDEYDIILFGPGYEKVFARYKGLTPR